MARSLLNSQRTFPLVIALTMAVALLPAAALGWTRPFTELFKLVLNPFALAGNALAQWAYPAHSAVETDSPRSAEEVAHLQEEMVKFERLYLAERAKVDALQRQLEQLQKLPPEYMNTPVHAMTAHIGLRSPVSAAGAVVLSRGANHGVKPGAIAVFDGDDLVGRVTSDVSGMQCTLMPLTNPATGLLDAVIFPKDDPSLSFANAPNVQLTPRGDGTFVGQLDRLKVVNVGDEVRLFDDRWPAPAKAMLIGAVESIKTDDMEPLRNAIVVRPAFQLSQLREVVLKIELEGGQANAAAGRTDPEASR